MDNILKFSFLTVPAAVIFLILIVGLQPIVLADTVTVSATVATTVSCASSISSTAFGTLSSGSVATSSPNASTTLSCNSGSGCTLTVADASTGLATSSPAYTIPSPASGNPASSTLAAGTEGYGIHATTTSGGSGGTLNIESRYKWSAAGNLVFGGLTTGGKTLASSTASVSNRQLLIEHGAAISGTTQAGKYEDTITYSCTGN